MYEGLTELTVDDAYTELRRILLDMRCQLLWTIPPEAIEVRQGSWIGLSPVSMAKHLRFRLYHKDNSTRITSVAYWPMVLIASLVVFYSACFFLLGIITYIATQAWVIPLLRAPFGLVIITLFGIILLLAILHVYSYIKRSNAIQKILNLLKARGSPLHRRVKEARLRKGGN